METLKTSQFLHRHRNQDPGRNSDSAMVAGVAGILLCPEMDVASPPHPSELAVREAFCRALGKFHCVWTIR